MTGRDGSCSTTTAGRARTSTCDWKRAACSGAGRCPRACPTTPAHDRLAIAVDDHELEHAGYEDEHKTIADDGTWEELDRTERRLLFTLHGRHGARRYALIHTGGTQWLLHLTRDQRGTGG